MRRSRSRHGAAIIAASLVVAGFAMVFLGWKGGAATLFVPTQVAYGVSGGMVGVALVGTGLAVASVHLTRLSTARRSLALQRLVDDTVDIVVALRDRTAGGTRALTVPLPRQRSAVVTATRPAAGASNGQGGELPDHAQWQPDVVMVVGTKTFHAPDCRVITDPQQALNLTEAEARAVGLRPCRVCGGGEGT